MASRDTRTGAVLEQMVLPALRMGGYECETQVHVGERLGGGRHMADAVARDPQSGTSFLVSVKWQQVPGTAEQKVPFEAMCLADIVRKAKENYLCAYLVLGGEGWKLRPFFTSGELREHLRHGELVSVISLETFVAMANRRELHRPGPQPELPL